MYDEKEILNAKAEDNEEIDEDDGIVQLVNEDGDTLDFFFVATIQYKDDWFAFFQPAEPMADIDDDEIVIFKIVDVNGEDTFEPIEDEALLDEVYDEYVRLYNEHMDDEDGIDVHCDCGCEHHHHHDGEECDCGCDHEGECGEHEGKCDCDGECKHEHHSHEE